MAEKRLFKMANAQHGGQIIKAVWDFTKALLTAGHAVVVEVRTMTRSLEQNAKFHALVGDIAKAGCKWAGKPRNTKEWKVLLVSGHAVATKEGSEMVPGLEGEFVNLRESTASMSVRRASSLIEYTLAFCAQNDVPMSEATARWIGADAIDCAEPR